MKSEQISEGIYRITQGGKQIGLVFRVRPNRFSAVRSDDSRLLANYKTLAGATGALLGEMVIEVYVCPHCGGDHLGSNQDDGSAGAMMQFVSWCFDCETDINKATKSFTLTEWEALESLSMRPAT